MKLFGTVQPRKRTVYVLAAVAALLVSGPAAATAGGQDAKRIPALP